MDVIFLTSPEGMKFMSCRSLGLAPELRFPPVEARLQGGPALAGSCFTRGRPPHRLMAVDVQAGPQFRAGHPQPLFNLAGFAGPRMGLGRDAGRQTLPCHSPPDSSVSSVFRLIVVTDWFEDILR
jgi:hypothetical protein